MGVETNAGDVRAAAVLSGLGDLDQGTLLTAVVHKMGELRGPSGLKSVYGDDTVRVLIWTGFEYKALIARSQRILNQRLAKGGYIERLVQSALEKHPEASIDDACYALQETRDWFRRVLSSWGPPQDALPSNTWQPLEIQGVQVRGCKVYTGPSRPDDPRAPIPGTIYVQGVKLGEKMIASAPNGHWRPNSKPKTLAKNLIKADLPVGLYCQYRLQPDRVSGLAVEKAAAMIAKQESVGVDPDALRHLFKIA